MDTITRFTADAESLRKRKANLNAIIGIIYYSHSIVSGILTLCRAKTPVIPTKKNKQNSISDNQVLLTIPRSKNSKIAYITVKKIKKCLTFDYRCVRNKLQ